MTLTSEHVEVLTARFQAHEHEILRGFVYITEDAITPRLTAVDPCWSWEVVNVYTRENQAVAVGRLTVCGVVRDGIGMATIMEKGAEAEKSAVTDALKRAARLFGIGAYLLSAPQNMTDKKLAEWLSGKPAPAPSAASEPPAAAAQSDDFQAYVVDAQIQDEMHAAGQEALIGDMVCRVLSATRKVSSNGHHYELALAPNPRNRLTVNLFDGKKLRDNCVDTDGMNTGDAVSTTKDALGRPLTLLVQMRVSKRDPKFWDVVNLGGGQPLPHWTEFPDKRKNVVAHLAKECQINNLSWDELPLHVPDRLPASFDSPRGVDGYAAYFIGYKNTHKPKPKHD